MEPRSLAARPDVVAAPTTPRATATPPRAAKFSEVLSRTVVRGAETAVRSLPGAPLMAVALRGGAGSPGALGVPLAGGATRSGTPEGPMPSGQLGSTTLSGVGTGTVGGVAGGVPGMSGAPAAEGAGLEASLAQSQEMNLYFLQVQEAVNAQNRSYTALSNVLKAQHDTVKTAIGNIR